MNLLYLQILIAVGLLGALFFFALIVAAGLRLSRVSLRALAERQAALPLLEKLSEDRSMVLLPLEVTIDLLNVAVALLAWQILTGFNFGYPAWGALGVAVLAGGLLRHLLPRLVVQIDAESVLLRSLRLVGPIYPLLRIVTWPIWGPVRRNHEYRRQRQPLVDAEEETGDEEIQAYLDVGAEEGIFELQETKLIQSALEFGNTLVREIMTPRSEIIGVEDNASIKELRETFVTSKHSRLPVHHGGLDNVVGVVYIRKFLGKMEELGADSPITSLIDEVPIVPETKKVTQLLQELQRTSGNMAIVINEFGGVAGLVTTEDLVEEIVGEIHDEDEQQSTDIELLADGRYVVSGGVELDDLEEVLGVDLDHPDVTTIAGLVVAELGRVPAVSEAIEVQGLSVTILEADPRRIRKLRVHSSGSGRIDPIVGVEPPTSESPGVLDGEG